MTREEAIQHLENLKISYPFADVSEWADMAIEALQWQDRILTQIEDIVLKEHGERRDE